MRSVSYIFRFNENVSCLISTVLALELPVVLRTIFALTSTGTVAQVFFPAFRNRRSKNIPTFQKEESYTYELPLLRLGLKAEIQNLYKFHLNIIYIKF